MNRKSERRYSLVVKLRSRYELTDLETRLKEKGIGSDQISYVYMSPHTNSQFCLKQVSKKYRLAAKGFIIGAAIGLIYFLIAFYGEAQYFVDTKSVALNLLIHSLCASSIGFSLLYLIGSNSSEFHIAFEEQGTDPITQVVMAVHVAWEDREEVCQILDDVVDGTVEEFDRRFQQEVPL